ELLERSTVGRGVQSGQRGSGEFEIGAEASVVSSGGIGGKFDLVRQSWPVDRLGPPPGSMISGVPHHVDGRMIGITQQAGGAVINGDRM
ncbi:FAD-binding protein, partial [Rhizobiaceae sp. 2RAB30]